MQEWYQLSTKIPINLSYHETNIDNEGIQIRVSPNKAYKAIATFEGDLKIFQMSTGQNQYSLSDFEDCGTALTSFEWRPEGTGRTENVLAATYTNNKIIHWLATTGKRLTTIDCESEAIDIAYNPNGTKFVIGCEDGRIYEYDDVKKVNQN